MKQRRASVKQPKARSKDARGLATLYCQNARSCSCATRTWLTSSSLPSNEAAPQTVYVNLKNNAEEPSCRRSGRSGPHRITVGHLRLFRPASRTCRPAVDVVGHESTPNGVETISHHAEKLCGDCV